MIIVQKVQSGSRLMSSGQVLNMYVSCNKYNKLTTASTATTEFTTTAESIYILQAHRLKTN